MGSAKQVFVIAAFALASCSSQGVPAATPTTKVTRLSVYATTATAPLLTDLTTEYARTRPDVTLTLGVGSYGSLVGQLERGEIDYFMSNHLPPESTLWAAPIGQDGTVIVTHPANGTLSLSIPQIRDIYRGRVANWSELGGVDAGVRVISREDGAGTRAEFDRLVMGELPTTPGALVAPSSSAMVESVANTPGGIGYISLAYLDERVRAVPVDGVLPTQASITNNTYPLRSTLFIVGAAEPEDPAYRAFIVWVQGAEGQAVVARRYVPLLPPE